MSSRKQYIYKSQYVNGVSTLPIHERKDDTRRHEVTNPIDWNENYQVPSPSLTPNRSQESRTAELIEKLLQTTSPTPNTSKESRWEGRTRYLGLSFHGLQKLQDAREACVVSSNLPLHPCLLMVPRRQTFISTSYNFSIKRRMFLIIRLRDLHIVHEFGVWCWIRAGSRKATLTANERVPQRQWKGNHWLPILFSWVSVRCRARAWTPLKGPYPIPAPSEYITRGKNNSNVTG